MTTIAAIAAEAFDGVSLDITDVVPAATLVRTVAQVYDPTTGTMATAPEPQTGRMVYCNPSAVPDIFPGYTVGPSDQLLLLEGFTSVRKNDVVNGLTVMQVQDIGGAGSLFHVVVR